ncbi:hypothetical protein vseg_019314 [Gypsophila vaccaria]
MANKAQNLGETSLCANNCGFFGNPSTNNLCSKCYKDYLKTQSNELIISGQISSSSPCNKLGDKFEKQKVEEQSVEVGDSSTKSTETRTANRCSLCKKRVGLTGFKCRCEQTFCSVHRYSDKHNCAFDYKGSAQDAIARANPVVKAEKVEKI